MTRSVVGIDVGGTKTHVRALRDDKVECDRIGATRQWWREPEFGHPQDIANLLGWVPETCRKPDSVMVVGAHGADSDALRDVFTAGLAEQFPGRIKVVNDAVLVGPAAGYLRATIALIAGTGAIAVATSAAGELSYKGGHGFLLGDEGSAPALVRDLARAVLRSTDAGEPDPVAADHLARAFGLPDSRDRVTQLGVAMYQRHGVTDWGDCCPAVFEAAAAGSSLAAGVIALHAVELARLVDLHLAEGASPEAVILSGGVVGRQPSFADAIRRAIHSRHPQLPVELLTTAPVAGAIALALNEFDEKADQGPHPATPELTVEPRPSTVRPSPKGNQS